MKFTIEFERTDCVNGPGGGGLHDGFVTWARITSDSPLSDTTVRAYGLEGLLDTWAPTDHDSTRDAARALALAFLVTVLREDGP
jgi:hypothetical protein